MTSGPMPIGALPPDRRHTLDLSALAGAPQVTTDDEGRHWRQGREYVAVYVDGELDYQPKEEA